MKRTFCILTLAAGIALGALRMADLVLWTDPLTGFCTAGPVWLRYLLMLPAVALALATGWAIHKKQFFAGIGRVPCLALVPLALASEVYGFLTILTVAFSAGEPSRSHHMTQLRAVLDAGSDLVRAVLFVVFGVWCLLLFMEQYSNHAPHRGMLYLGVAGSAAFYVHTVVRFIVQPASWQRVQPAVEILAALSALLFVTSYLRANYLPGRVGGTRSVCRNGLLAFFFCTCLAAPQSVWQYLHGVASPVALPLAVTLGFTGLLGAAAAAGTSWAD